MSESEELINRPCVIKRKIATGERNGLGNEILDTEEVNTLCELQQQPSFRKESPAEISDTRWVVYFRLGETIGNGDEVVVDGEGEFEVFGEPWRVRDPETQLDSHLEVGLRRTVAPDDLGEEAS